MEDSRGAIQRSSHPCSLASLTVPLAHARLCLLAGNGCRLTLCHPRSAWVTCASARSRTACARPHHMGSEVDLLSSTVATVDSLTQPDSACICIGRESVRSTRREPPF